MKYVKLIAKPNTWFKAGTEAYDYNCDLDNPVRVTLADWEQCNGFVICVRGTRICEDNPNERGMGYQPGDERPDGEACGCDEFEVTIVEEPR
jgi:hypothetical protein